MTPGYAPGRHTLILSVFDYQIPSLVGLANHGLNPLIDHRNDVAVAQYEARVDHHLDGTQRNTDRQSRHHNRLTTSQSADRFG